MIDTIKILDSGLSPNDLAFIPQFERELSQLCANPNRATLVPDYLGIPSAAGGY